MDFLTIVGYVITAILGFVGAWAYYRKALSVLKEVAELLNDAVVAMSDGNVSKAELEQIIKSAQEVVAAVKA